MSDTRFTILGIGLVFAGFLILGVFGGNFQKSNIEMAEFGDCYDYSQEIPTPINCSYKIFDQSIFFAIVIAIIAGGAIALVKAIKGKWDSQVKPEDMVGPSKDHRSEKEDKE